MSAPEKTSRSYIEAAQNEFEAYTQNILRENEKLRAMTTMLESDSRRLHLEVIEARRILAHKEDFRRAVQSLESDRQQMTDELAKALKERDSAVSELDSIRVQLDDVEQENLRYAREYQRVKNQSNNLFNLYIASYQLHASVERKQVLASIQEIIINLIGSEEMAIFEFNQKNGRFELASSFGVDAAKLKSFKAGDGVIGARLASGEVFVDGEARAGESKLTACVPLKINDTIIGAILVFRLLDHKQALQAVDHELFELLSVHAANALYCATLHERYPLVAVA
jgi:hypothetical protein